MIRILVANRKGGCGKSTIATNLAGAYAAGGLRVALADLDTLHCSTDWLVERPDHVAPIRALDWSHGIKKPPADIDRLVIDAPAGTSARAVEALLGDVDVVIVPVLPSAFDEGSVEPFLADLMKAKRVRKDKTRVGVIRNRYRANTKAGHRLNDFFSHLDCVDLGGLPDRTVYAEAAAYGLSLFDLPGKRLEALRQDWVPLLKFIETAPVAATA